MQTQVYPARAKTAEVWDAEGKRYIDFAAGIAVVNTGHCHPKVIAAVREQAALFTHTCHQVLPCENYLRLAERLNKKVPGDFGKKTVIVTTGAEAVENAVKIARAVTGRADIMDPATQRTRWAEQTNTWPDPWSIAGNSYPAVREPKARFTSKIHASAARFRAERWAGLFAFSPARPIAGRLPCPFSYGGRARS